MSFIPDLVDRACALCKLNFEKLVEALYTRRYVNDMEQEDGLNSIRTLERISQLPRAKQRAVMQVLDAMLAQQGR